MASSPIGFAVASSNFRIDNSQVSGNATVFDGSVIETRSGFSDVHLSQGARLRLGPESRATIFHDRMFLERGKGELEGGHSYTVEAARLRIEPAPGAAASLALNGPNSLLLVARAGALRVRTREGFLIANLDQGKSVEFDSSASGAAAPSKVTGKLSEKAGAFWLRDEASGLEVRIMAEQLEKLAGHRVEATGAIMPGKDGAGSVMHATQVVDRCERDHAAAAAGAKAGAAKAGAGAAKAGAAAAKTATVAGLSTKAVVLGVGIAAASTATGLGIAAAEDSSNNNISR